MHSTLTLRAWLTACGVVSILAGCNRPKGDAAPESGAVAEDNAKDAAGTANKGKVALSSDSTRPASSSSRQPRRIPSSPWLT
jgi:hypothetical protein